MEVGNGGRVDRSVLRLSSRNRSVRRRLLFSARSRAHRLIKATVSSEVPSRDPFSARVYDPVKRCPRGIRDEGGIARRRIAGGRPINPGQNGSILANRRRTSLTWQELAAA